MKQIIIFLLLLQMQIFAQNAEKRPHNVIFIIGDGMGISQTTLTQLLHGKLALDQFPVTGLVATHSANAWVTDSAASSEAIVNEVLGGKPLKFVLRKRAGIKKITNAEQKLFNNAKSKFDKGAVIGEIVSKRLGVNFISFEYRKDKPNTTHGHDGAMVPVYSFGPGSNKFTGTLDNTDIPKRIRKLLGNQVIKVDNSKLVLFAILANICA